MAISPSCLCTSTSTSRIRFLSGDVSSNCFCTAISAFFNAFLFSNSALAFSSSAILLLFSSTILASSASFSFLWVSASLNFNDNMPAIAAFISFSSSIFNFCIWTDCDLSSANLVCANNRLILSSRSLSSFSRRCFLLLIKMLSSSASGSWFANSLTSFKSLSFCSLRLELKASFVVCIVWKCASFSLAFARIDSKRASRSSASF